MKTKQPLTLALIGALTLGVAAPAFAYDPNWDAPGATRNLNWGPGANVAGSENTGIARSGTALAGSPANVAAATRTVSLSGIRNVNVMQGEVVKFVAGDKAFAWRFDTLDTPRFKLAEIAPKDFPAGEVVVFVAHDPAHMGG